MKSPTVAVARYAAIGSGASQLHVVSPSAGDDPSSSPFATATSPSGTVMSNEYVALSVGWSLTGNHVAEPSGSLTTIAPSRVVTQP